jgi:uncharacterized protein (DUF2384 family)
MSEDNTSMSSADGLDGQILASIANAIEIEVGLILERLAPKLRKPGVRAASKFAGAVASHVASLSRSRQMTLDECCEFILRQLQQSISLYAELPATRRADDNSLIVDLADLPIQKAVQWAGEVAGPTLLERKYGIARSTLHRWQRLRQVISFRAGGKKYVFPLAQFIDGRPVSGISAVLEVFGDDRRAWQWLISPCASLDDHVPLRLLRIEQIDQVIDEARRHTRNQFPSW